MTLSISQAHIGDIEDENYWRTGIKAMYIIHTCMRTHTHIRARIHERISQRSFLTAVNNYPTAASASDSQKQNILICSWDFCLFVWFTFNFQLKHKCQAGRERDRIYEGKLNIGEIMVCCCDSKCRQNGKRSIKKVYNFLIKAIFFFDSIHTVPVTRLNKDREWFETSCAFQDKIIFTCSKIYEFVLGFETNWDDLIISFQAN